METDRDTWYQVTVRIASDNYTPEEITSAISIRPTFEKRKGEFVEAIADGSKYCTNLWGLSYTTDDKVPFEEQLSGLLEFLEERLASLRKFLSISGVDAELFLGFGSSDGQGVASFSPQLLTRISALGFGIQLDLYPPS